MYISIFIIEMNRLFSRRVLDILPRQNMELLGYLKQHLSNTVNNSAYNWIRPSLWTSMFGKSAAVAGKITF